MKYFSMNGRIDKDLFERFIPFCNENFSEKCIIILNTNGGDTYLSETIIHIINSMPDVTLIIHSVYSAGFLIALKSNCRKILSKVSKGMWHLGRVDMSINFKNKPYWTEDECMVKNLPIEKKEGFYIARKVMTPKEYKDFKLDRDVYFDFKRMKEIFHDAEIMK